MRLSAEHDRILRVLAEGLVLKSHRTLDGEKAYRLHAMDGSPLEEVAPAVMDFLTRHRLIHSNMKFPAASYLLTEKGREIAETLTGRSTSALGADHFPAD